MYFKKVFGTKTFISILFKLTSWKRFFSSCNKKGRNHGKISFKECKRFPSPRQCPSFFLLQFTPLAHPLYIKRIKVCSFGIINKSLNWNCNFSCFLWIGLIESCLLAFLRKINFKYIKCLFCQFIQQINFHWQN